MGITVPRKQLELTLQRAVARAEGAEELSRAWQERVERIALCPSQSYVAAFGTALLAKASDERVDALSVKAGAGPTAYSMRGVVRILVEKASLYEIHLGRKGPEPLNNQPWFHSDRVDRATGISRDAQPYHRDLVRYLADLNRGSADDAMEGLVAFIRLRQAAERSEREAVAGLEVVAKAAIADLLALLALFINEDAENGRRGQALVAALLGLVHEDVRLSSVHNPTGLDVTVWAKEKLILGVEVKQKPVGEEAVLHLAEEAALRGVDKALFVALAPHQRHLDGERLRHEALELHGVVLAVHEGVAQAVVAAVVASPLSADQFAALLPNAYLGRMREHDVSTEGLRYWSDLCNGLNPTD